MKPFAALALLFSTFAFGQADLRPHDFVRVDSVPGATSDELYTRAKQWFATAYRDAQSVIQLDDPANKTIIGKGNFEYLTSVMIASTGRRGVVRYTIEIACRDGRYRLHLHGYIHEGTRYYDSTVGWVGPYSLGPLYDGPNCSTTYGKIDGAHLRNVCEKEVAPQLTENDEGIASRLLQAMSKPTSTDAKSDW